jgi:hypothetical protein
VHRPHQASTPLNDRFVDCRASIKFTANGTASEAGWLKILVNSALKVSYERGSCRLY